jgi:8-oxo-dGTP pyrophosphatase MutT (NUDIX family)
MRRDDGLILALGAASALAVAGFAAKAGSRALTDVGMVDGYWGRQGAGVLLTTGRQILLLRRSDEVLDPGVWGVPGGAVRVDDETGESEDLLDAAMNEVLEEAGLDVRGVGEVVRSTVFTAPRGSFRYTTFIIRVPEQWARASEPMLNWESDAWAWISEAGLGRYELHPGVTFTLGQAKGVVFS